MSLSFDTLLEGTMIGAEASALIEAEESKEESKAENDAIKKLVEEKEAKILKYDKYLMVIKQDLKDGGLEGDVKSELKETGKLISKNKGKLRNLYDALITNTKRQIKAAEKESKKSENKKDPSKLSRILFGIAEDYQNKVVEIEKKIAEVEKETSEAIDKINAKLPTSDKIKKISEDNVSKENLDKLQGTFHKIKNKIADMISKIKTQLTDPSIMTILGVVAFVIATYLAFYGVVKASGGNVGGIVNIWTNIKAGASLLKTASIGKRILILTVGTLLIGALGALGTAGWNYVKNALERKKNIK